MRISEEEYLEHREEYDGYCTNCQEWTRFGETEPDARGYECPDCENNSCVGAEEALMEGLISIGD